MPDLFAIETSDVENLSSTDLVRLLNHLIVAELRTEKLPLTLTQVNLRINDKDGGIDAWVQWLGGPEDTRHLPSRLTGFQSKAGDRMEPAECAKELLTKDQSGLKRQVHTLLKANGAYVLFSAADMTSLQKAERLGRMQEVVAAHLSGYSGQLLIRGGTDIAAWAGDDLWARTFLIRAAGRAQPALLATIEEWESLNPDLRNPFVWTDERRLIADDLARSARTPGSVFRIDGPPGLGKTRLALEALKLVADEGSSVVYFDAAYPGTELDLLRAIPNWRRNSVHGILVVDNCGADLHGSICAASRGSALSLVTIDYRQQSQATVVLERLGASAIEQIVRAHPLQVSPLVVHRVVAIADGWPLMAIEVLKALTHGQGTMLTLSDEKLLKRMVALTEYPEADRVLGVMSLFSHIGYRGNRKGEYEAVRALLTPEIPADRFYAIARQYQHKGFVSAIGRFWRVTPPPLATRLTKEWIETARPELQDALFSDSLPESLKPALAQRFADLGSSDETVAIARRLTTPGGRFGTLQGLIGRANAQVFQSLAEVDPPSAMDALRRVLLPLPDEELGAIGHEDARQTLVFALEGLAFHREQFADAARVLFALARNESEEWIGNNSSGTLVKLFSPFGSQTEADPRERLAILDEMLARDDEASVALTTAAISKIIDSGGHGYARVGPEFQGGRAPLEEWRPKTWDELYTYWAEGIDRLLRLSAKGDFARTRARRAFAATIRVLIAYRRWDDLERGLRELRGGPWADAAKELRSSLQFELAQAPEEDRARVNGYIDLIAPESLEDRTRLCINAPPDFAHGEGHFVDLAMERARDFAREVTDRGKTRDVLEILSTGNGRLNYEFGTAAAEAATDLTVLVEEALDAMRRAAEPRNVGVLEGILAVASDHHPALRGYVLDTIARDPQLTTILPNLTMVPTTTDDDVRRLIHALRDPKSSEPDPTVFSGPALAGIADPLVRDLLSSLVERRWYTSAFNLLFFGAHRVPGTDDLLARAIIESNIVASPVPGFLDYSVLGGAQMLAGDDRFAKFAAKLTGQIMDLVLSNPGFVECSRAAALWPALLGTHRDTIWRLVEARYLDLDRRQRLALLMSFEYLPEGEIEPRLALEQVPLDQLMAFAAKYPDEIPCFLAYNGNVIEHAEGYALAATPLMLALLEGFGNREDVLQNIAASLNSLSTVGPRAPYYQARIDLVVSIPTFGKPEIVHWKEHLIASLAAKRDEARTSDDEIQGGIF